MGGGVDSSGEIARRSRRTRLSALGLLCVTVAVALVLARLYHLGSAAILVSVLGGAPGLYLSYAGYRDDREAEADDNQLSPAEMADRLAVAVYSQWLEEASVRRLNDPYPLPVRWVAADPLLVDQWGTLTTLAASGAGWPQPSGKWASGPDELSGEGGQLADMLARVPTGRLLILGDPGAGKTILMTRLVLDLLARRDSGAEVPVLLSVASWDPSAEDLRKWLASELTITYTALLARARLGISASSRVQVLLDRGLILPILDGLDEIPDAARRYAIARINDAVRAGEHFVVTCRRAPFEDAVGPADGSRVTLRGAAGVELCPLDARVIAGYLQADAASPHDMVRWQPLLACLKAETPVAKVLSNPLMLSLARTIYSPEPGDLTRSAPDPAELCILADEVDIEARLLSAFVPAAYRNSGQKPGRPRTWTARRARRWLGFLARHLDRDIHGPDLAWWQLARTTPRAVTALATGLMTGLVTAFVIEIAFMVEFEALNLFGMYWLAIPTLGKAAGTGLGFALIGGLAACVVTAAAVTVASRDDRRARHGTRQTSRSRKVYPAGTSIITAGLLVGAAAWDWFPHWIAAGLGCAAAVLASLAVYQARRRGGTPDFRRGWSAAIIVGSVAGLTFGISGGVLGQGLGAGLAWGLTWGTAAGLAAGVGVMWKGRDTDRPAQGIYWHPRKAVIAAAIAGIAGGFIGMLANGSIFGFSFIFVFGIPFGVAVAAVAGLERVSDDLTANASPAVTLARDRRATLLLTFVTGIAAAFAVAVTAGGVDGENSQYPAQLGLSFGLGMGTSIGISAALTFGFAVNGFGSAWPGWLIARSWLALRGRIPLHLTSFLDDAYHRGVLRRVGAVYQFRHIELQRQLASEASSEMNALITVRLLALTRSCKKLPPIIRQYLRLCRSHLIWRLAGRKPWRR
jgi:hypothetical protein